MFIVLLSLILFALSTPAYATTYYVATTGSDSTGDGSQSNPWRWPKKCFSTGTPLVGGDTCHIGSGTFNGADVAIAEDLSTVSIPSGTAGAHTIIEGEGIGVTVLQPTSRGWWINNGTHYLTIKNLEWDHSSFTGGDHSCVIVYPNVSNLLFESVSCHHAGRLGSDTGFAGGLFLTDFPLTNVIFRHVKSYSNGTTRGHGIYARAHNVTIEHSELYDNAHYGAQVINGPNQTPAQNPVIHHNKIYSNGRAPTGGGLALGSIGGVIYRNEIYGNVTGAGIVDGYTAKSTPNKIFNNVVYNNPSEGIRCGLFSPTGVQCNISNNLVTGNGGDEIAFYASATNTGSHNACTSAESCSNAASKVTITALTSCTVSTTDFTQKSGSSCINTGTTIAGFASNGLPDIGAHESFSASSAVIDTQFMDITFGMDVNVPILPASGITGFTVACSGHASCPGSPTVQSAVKKTGTDSVIRLTISGITGDACSSLQTWTWSYDDDLGSNDVTDSALIGNSTNQKLFDASTQTVTETCSGSPTTPPAGPVLHYTFEDGSGTTVSDQSVGGTNDGTLTGSPLPTWVSPAGVVFTDGVNHYVETGYGSGDNPSSASRTVCWGGIPTDPSEAQKIVWGSNIGTNQRFYVGWIGGTWGLGIQDVGFTTGSEFPVVAERTHVCLRADSGSDLAELFVNGVKGTTAHAVEDYTSFTLASDIKIGLESSFAINYGGTTVVYFKIWESALTDQNIADDFTAFSQTSPAPTGTFAQVAHQFQLVRTPVTSYGALSATVNVVVGGAVALITQIDCTGANCDPTGARLYYSKNGGTFLQVPDVCTTDSVCFFGTPDADVLSGTLSALLSGALTATYGPTNTTAAAVPVFDLPQNGSFVRRSILKFGASVANGDTFCFKEYHQTDIALSSYTPTGGSCVNIVSQSMGVGF